MIGSKISHYVIEDHLGHGGMGTVYRGRDSVLGRTVAIKVISPDLVEQPEQRARLLREARAASRAATFRHARKSQSGSFSTGWTTTWVPSNEQAGSSPT